MLHAQQLGARGLDFAAQQAFQCIGHQALQRGHALQLHLGRVKQRMAAEGLDVLVVTEPANIYYLTGYDAWSFYTTQALVVFQEAELPLWIGRMMDALTARVTTYLPDDRVVPYPDIYVNAKDRHAAQFIAERILREAPSTAVIGVEMKVGAGCITAPRRWADSPAHR